MFAFEQNVSALINDYVKTFSPGLVQDLTFIFASGQIGRLQTNLSDEIDDRKQHRFSH